MAEEESNLLNALLDDYLTKVAPETAHDFQCLLRERDSSGEEKLLKFGQFILNMVSSDILGLEFCYVLIPDKPKCRRRKQTSSVKSFFRRSARGGRNC